MQTVTLNVTSGSQSTFGNTLSSPALASPRVELLSVEQDELNNLRREIVWQEHERTEFGRKIG